VLGRSTNLTRHSLTIPIVVLARPRAVPALDGANAPASFTFHRNTLKGFVKMIL